MFEGYILDSWTDAFNSKSLTDARSIAKAYMARVGNRSRDL